MVIVARDPLRFGSVRKNCRDYWVKLRGDGLKSGHRLRLKEIGDQLVIVALLMDHKEEDEENDDELYDMQVLYSILVDERRNILTPNLRTPDKIRKRRIRIGSRHFTNADIEQKVRSVQLFLTF